MARIRIEFDSLENALENAQIGSYFYHSFKGKFSLQKENKLCITINI